MRTNKKGYELGFSWIFAIIVGAFIIFLAVYASIKFVGLHRFGIESATAKQIGILLNPIETNLESSKVSLISVSTTTRIYNRCDETRKFGSQGIRVATKSGIGKEWSDFPGVTSSFTNKYLFSDEVSEGERNFFALSKPLNMPFKVADLIILWSDKESYCFVSMPSEIERELGALGKAGGLKNIYNVSTITLCPSESKKVCFIPPLIDGCDIKVSINSKTVKKTGKQAVEYIINDNRESRYALLYAAIFSEPEIYNCQLKRLVKRAHELTALYKSKSVYLEGKYSHGAPRLNSYFDNYIQKTESFLSGSASLKEVYDAAKALGDENGGIGSGYRMF